VDCLPWLTRIASFRPIDFAGCRIEFDLPPSLEHHKRLPSPGLDATLTPALSLAVQDASRFEAGEQEVAEAVERLNQSVDFFLSTMP
jgi:hypothetical protein